MKSPLTKREKRVEHKLRRAYSKGITSARKTPKLKYFVLSNPYDMETQFREHKAFRNGYEECSTVWRTDWQSENLTWWYPASRIARSK